MRVLRIGQLARQGTLLVAAVSLALALGAVEARADRIFSLSGVTFDDGTSLTGTFTTDDALLNLLAWDLTTVDGSITGFHYTEVTAPVNFSSIPFILVVEDATPNHILELTFDGGLTAAGAAIKNDPDGSFEQSEEGKRIITGGRVIAGVIPEPSSILMGSISTLGALGALGWRRRRASAA